MPTTSQKNIYFVNLRFNEKDRDSRSLVKLDVSTIDTLDGRVKFWWDILYKVFYKNLKEDIDASTVAKDYIEIDINILDILDKKKKFPEDLRASLPRKMREHDKRGKTTPDVVPEYVKSCLSDKILCKRINTRLQIKAPYWLFKKYPNPDKVIDIGLDDKRDMINALLTLNYLARCPTLNEFETYNNDKHITPVVTTVGFAPIVKFDDKSYDFRRKGIRKNYYVPAIIPKKYYVQSFIL
jgi:hypothetical protein